jgi:O-antigen/teichoic acid export membrane protein
VAEHRKNSLPFKYEEYFNTDNLEADLKNRSVRGGAIVLISQGSKFLLQMGSTIVLARLLTPADYGLIEMVTVIIRFVQLFKDLGLSNATIQQSEISHEQVSTLFWINIALSSAIALLVALIAPFVAEFYGQPDLEKITLALASIFIFSGLTVQHQALLMRKMEFASLAKVDVVSILAGAIAAIVSAMCGAGYWALVILQLATNIVNAIGIWIYCRWRPGLPSRKADVSSMLAFGGNLTGFNAVNYFSRNLDNILIGRVWGDQALGLYGKAYQLILLPIQQINNPISNVALPTLSRLQNQPEQYRRYYLKAILLIVTIGMPVVAFMFACTDLLILAILGEQWLDAVPIFRWLAPAAFIGTLNVSEGWTYQSLALTDRLFRWGIFASTCNIIVFLISIRWGVVGVAISYSLFLIVFKIPAILYCFQKTPLRFVDLVRTIYKPMVASIGAAMIVILIEYAIAIKIQVVVGLLIYALLYGFCYLAIWMLLPNGRSTLLNIVQIVKELKKPPTITRVD